MLSAQWYKVLYDLWSNKTRTILIILSIMVGMVAMGATMSANPVLSNSLLQSYAETNYSNGSLNTLQSFDEEFVRSVRHVTGVAEADARRTWNTRALDSKGVWRNLQIITVTDFNNIRVNKISPLSGAWPPARHQITIDTYSLETLGARVGDNIWIELPDHTSRPVQIAGTGKDISLPPSKMSDATYAFALSDTLEWLGAPAGFNDLKFVTSSQTDAAAILTELKNKAEDAGFTVTSYAVIEDTPMGTTLSSLLLILQIGGVLSLLLSIFLIYNTVEAIVAQQVKQIGVMKAIGGRTWQIMSMYLALVMIYGVVALLLALPISIFGAQVLSQYFSSMFQFSVFDSPVQPTTVLIQSIVAILVPLAASVYPLVNGLTLSATEALSGQRSTGKATVKPGLIDRLLSGTNLWATREWLKRPLVLAVRNMFRQKVRLSLTLTTLVLGGAVFMAVLNLQATITTYMDRGYQMKNYNVQVSFKEPRSTSTLQQDVTSVSGVGETDTWTETITTRVRPDGIESKQYPLMAVNPGSNVYITPYLIQGRWLIPGDENAVVLATPVTKYEPDIQVGQEIVLRINNRNRPFRVVGLVLGERGETIYANQAEINPLIHTSHMTSTLLVKLNPSAGIDEDQLRANLDTYFQNNNIAVAAIKTIGAEKATMQTANESITILLIILAIMLAVVGGLGLMGTMSINVIERTREIGVMRSIGASNGGISQVFMLEGLAIGLASWLFAAPLSIPITNLISNNIGQLMSNVPYSAVFNLNGLMIWLGIVIVLSLLANYLPARSATRLTVREVLAYE